MFFAVYTLLMVGSLASGFCQNWQQLTITRIITGLAIGGLSVVDTVLLQEMSAGNMWVVNGEWDKLQLVSVGRVKWKMRPEKGGFLKIGFCSNGILDVIWISKPTFNDFSLSSCHIHISHDISDYCLIKRMPKLAWQALPEASDQSEPTLKIVLYTGAAGNLIVSVAQFVALLLSYYIPNWRTFCLVVTIAGLPAYLFYLWVRFSCFFYSIPGGIRIWIRICFHKTF